MANKIYLLVKNFSGINEDVEILKTERNAHKVFREYTGFEFCKAYTNPSSPKYSEDYSETKIFEIDLPDFLRLV